MTKEQLDKLIALAAQASTGPWESDSHDNRASDTVYHDVSDGKGSVIFDSCNSEDMQVECDSDEGYDHYWDQNASRNFAFICALRNAWPEIQKALIAHVADQEEKVAR